MDHYLRANPRALVKSFEFRAIKPLIEGRMVTLQRQDTPAGATLWTLDDCADRTMTASLNIH
jgi:hydroxyacyl-ACP dehydratase HTD2-like protein with hotdog domain